MVTVFWFLFPDAYGNGRYRLTSVTPIPSISDMFHTAPVLRNLLVRKRTVCIENDRT